MNGSVGSHRDAERDALETGDEVESALAGRWRKRGVRMDEERARGFGDPEGVRL